MNVETIPAVVTIADVCRILRLSESAFYRLMAKRALALVELQPLDSTRRFTGESLKREITLRAQRLKQVS